MATILIQFIAALCSLVVSDETTSDFELPKTWTKDFTISLSFTGSMDGSSTHITFTYDSGKYAHNSGMKAPTKSRFALTATDRAEILKKLHELKVDKIHSEISIAPVNDGWSTAMCFAYHCIEAGTSAKISDKDKAIFSNAYAYLESFAAKKSGDKKRN